MSKVKSPASSSSLTTITTNIHATSAHYRDHGSAQGGVAGAGAAAAGENLHVNGNGARLPQTQTTHPRIDGGENGHTHAPAAVNGQNGNGHVGAAVNGTGTVVAPERTPTNLNEASSTPGPSTPSLLSVESVVAERWRRGAAKKRTAEEAGITVSVASRVITRLTEDHQHTTDPDIETPFVDTLDVVKRLLPYHVYQHPLEDLHARRRKGKGKATEEDILREEIAETKFALECWKRRTALEKRFRRARVSSGKRNASDDQAYWLAQTVLEGDRTETAALNAELRSARQELDKVEREKRAAAAAAASAAAIVTPASATATVTTRPAYYPPQQQGSTSTAYASQYRNYSTYSYSQGYNTQYAYQPYTIPGATPATTSSSPSYGASAAYPPPVAARTATTTYTRPPVSSSTAGTSGTPAAGSATPTTIATAKGLGGQTGAIPITLPLSSLSALSALGIVPVAAPAAGQTVPAAVHRGTTNNGASVSLEINVSALQQSQLNGLAFILSALTSRGNGSVTATAGSGETETEMSAGSS
ncbi:hypothetical protein EUX98_g3409 [Antrodiella citrinella]|uniref:GLTSCR protein conserved domain-containing protein n=1 Tax=Antrodiella citrinella TaxID=2447956 RepID=A0A4S4MWM1_9APHY|nr:hypothetical protein EUX98_g3409 [Antrodiella citrinella]